MSHQFSAIGEEMCPVVWLITLESVVKGMKPGFILFSSADSILVVVGGTEVLQAKQTISGIRV
jgi:hypothetical protein